MTQGNSERKGLILLIHSHPSSSSKGIRAETQSRRLEVGADAGALLIGLPAPA